MKCHKISDEITFSDSVVETQLVDEYMTLVKILLAYLHNYRASKAKWAEQVNNIRRSLWLKTTYRLYSDFILQLFAKLEF